MMYVDMRDRAEKMELRVMLVGWYGRDSEEEIAYLKSKNLFMDFILEQHNKHCHIDSSRMFTMLSYWDQTHLQTNNIEYKGEHYIETSNGLKTNVYKILPPIYDDENFTWKHNRKFNIEEATVVSGMFEFFFAVDSLNNCVMSVKYAKCDNFHRNKVTISDMQIKDVTNMILMDAIKQWKTQFAREINEI